MAVVRSILIWAAIVVITIVSFALLIPIAFVAWPFDPKKNAAHFVARTWARLLLRVNPACRITIEGEENLQEIGGNGAAVLCANHQSMADIVGLYYLGYPFKWISKKEIAYVPIIGWAMILAGYIFLKRGDKESIKACMAKSHEWLGRGVSITMFPEGTRTFDGRLKSFKDGAFRMSADSGRPVVPVVLHGTKDLVQKGSWKFAARTRIVVRVGKPIPVNPGAAREEEISRLRDATRAWILKNMAEIAGTTEAALDASGTASVSGNKPLEAGV
jgi:1-acyl-sn-glycerol-3-phosphate acyltransferase